MDPFATVLIVCEGSKTEPKYLQGAKFHYKLANIDVEVVHPDGTDPLTIVEYAIKADDYENVYCVFDRDSHVNFEPALHRLRDHVRHAGERIKAIISRPCFEFWLLLHFKYTSQGFAATGRKSVADVVFDTLRVEYPEYSKDADGVFEVLLPKLGNAIRHSTRLGTHNAETGSISPATNMHDLITYLSELRK